MPHLGTYRMFECDTICHSLTPFHFVEAADKYNIGPRLKIYARRFNQKVVTLDELVDDSKAVVFLIIRNDTVIYENYKAGFNRNSIVTSFSVAKSYVSAMTGIAIDEGFIKSENQPITDFFPELLKKDPRFAAIKLYHLLKHTSGLKYQSVMGLYYGTNLAGFVDNIKVKCPPGQRFYYDNGNTELLGLIVEKATGMKLGKYLQEKIWKKIGTESDFTWSIDNKKNNIIKSFCCLNGQARDFAKFGRLYMNKGKWDNEQVVSERWVRESTKLDTTAGSLLTNQYFWWIGPREYGSFFAGGLYGQFIYVYPKKNMMIIRFAERNFSPDYYWYSIIFPQIMDQL